MMFPTNRSCARRSPSVAVAVAGLFVLMLVFGGISYAATQTQAGPRGHAARKHKKKKVLVRCAVATVTCTGRVGPTGPQGLQGLQGLQSRLPLVSHSSPTRRISRPRRFLDERIVTRAATPTTMGADRRGTAGYLRSELGRASCCYLGRGCAWAMDLAAGGLVLGGSNRPAVLALAPPVRWLRSSRAGRRDERGWANAQARLHADAGGPGRSQCLKHSRADCD
jgi:hypothetical protein